MRVLERLQQRPVTDNDADDESEPQHTHHHNGLSNGSVLDGTTGSSSTESTNLNGSASSADAQLKPSPRRRPSRIPLLGATKQAAPKPPANSKDSLKSLTQRNGNASLSSSSHRNKTGRDSSRESLNKSSLNKSYGSREPTSRSLPRNNSLGKNSLSRPKDSLESNGQQQQQPVTPPRRPPAPARRSQSQSARPDATVSDAAGKVRTVKQFFWTTWLK